MAKKEDKIVEEKKEVKKEIKTIDHDFGREDLNELRDKLNEVIANI